MLEILIDADMLLDALLDRAGITGDAIDIWEILRFRQIKGSLTDVGFNRIIEVLGKIDPNAAELIALSIESRLSIHETTVCHVRKARAIPNSDFESALEIVCAYKNSLGAIITHRPQDFSCARVETLSVRELLTRQNLEDTVLKNKILVLSGDGSSMMQLGQSLDENYLEELEKLRVSTNEIFKGLSLRETDLSGQDLQGMDFVDARLLHADLSSSLLCRANFCGANLYEADLSRTNLEGSDLSDARLVHANLMSAELQYSQAKQADVKYACLREANLNSANWDGSILRSADLRSATLKHTFLNDVDLTQACMDGACLIGASLVYSKFNEASLQNANLQAANLMNADLRGANLTGACLMNSNLTDADLRGAILDNVDLCGANLTRVKLDSPLPISLRHSFRDKA